MTILEQSGLIVEVGEWILKTALEQCRVWRERIPQLHMSINMSYIQLRQRGIANRILDIVERSGVPGSAITLEVTESMQIQDLQRFNRIFCKLLNLHDEDILKTTNLGLWVIRLSKDGTRGEIRPCARCWGSGAS